MSLRRLVLILAVAVFFMALLVDWAYGQTIYLPQVSQRCNPCAHSVPMPTVTPTPFMNEPPMPTVEAQP